MGLVLQRQQVQPPGAFGNTRSHQLGDLPVVTQPGSLAAGPGTWVTANLIARVLPGPLLGSQPLAITCLPLPSSPTQGFADKGTVRGVPPLCSEIPGGFGPPGRVLTLQTRPPGSL